MFLAELKMGPFNFKTINYHEFLIFSLNDMPKSKSTCSLCASETRHIVEVKRGRAGGEVKELQEAVAYIFNGVFPHTAEGKLVCKCCVRLLLKLVKVKKEVTDRL